MKLGYNQTIEQQQKLTLTPNLIQAINILQYNSQELDDYVSEQMLTNPVLEKLSEESYSEDEQADWQRQSRRDTSFYKDPGDQFVGEAVTLMEHLLFQWQFVKVDRKHSEIGKYIIESLDDNGYMTQSVEQIAESMNVSGQTVEDVLSEIQSLEPFGVGARNLAECLRIQLMNNGYEDETYYEVIDKHIDDLASNRIAVIAKKLGRTIDEMQEICDCIKALEPKPGRVFAGKEETRYIIPDVLVEEVDGQLVVILNNGNTPRLTVSSYYKSLLKSGDKDEELTRYLTDRLNSARWLIKSIDQRANTIYNVSKAIVGIQEDFFRKGKKYLKPMTLKDIADEVGIHESTVSRSISGKYIQCSQGVFEMKFFFSAKIRHNAGEDVSAESIKELIKEMVANENQSKPLSDQAMVEKMTKDGIKVSRRVVAKYRDELGILSSSKRRRY